MSTADDLKRLRAALRRPRLEDLFRQMQGEGYRTNAAASELRGLNFADAPDPPPWFVRAVLGFGAWVAALLLMLFLGLGGVLTNEVSASIVGLILLAAGAGMSARLEHDFWRQFAIAFAIAGLVLSIAGFSSFGDASTSEVVALVFGLLTFAFYPDGLLRFVGAGTAAVALVLLSLESEVQGSLDVVVLILMGSASAVWLAPSRLDLGPLGPRRAPATFAFLLTALCTLAFGAPQDGGHHLPQLLLWPATLGLALGLVALAFLVLRRGGRSLFSKPGIALLLAVAAIAVATSRTPGILAALSVFVLSTQRRNGLMSGLAVAFLAAFLSFYYYSLAATLMAKSAILVGSGVALLILSAFLHRGAQLQPTGARDPEGAS